MFFPHNKNEIFLDPPPPSTQLCELFDIFHLIQMKRYEV